MEMRLQPNNWSCLPTAFAMAMDTTPAILIKQLGHDGSAIWWPDNPEPYNRRGFHVQEIIHIGWLLFWNISCFQPTPMSGSPFCFKQHEVPLLPGLFKSVMMQMPGVVVGEINGKHHSVAWDMEQVFDPNGTTYSIEDFSIREFYAVTKR